MTDPLITRLVGRTVVVAGYVVVLAVAGSPGWLAALLSLVLVAVWAAPFLLASTRRRAVARPRGESAVTVTRGGRRATVGGSEGE